MALLFCIFSGPTPWRPVCDIRGIFPPVALTRRLLAQPMNTTAVEILLSRATWQRSRRRLWRKGSVHLPSRTSWPIGRPRSSASFRGRRKRRSGADWQWSRWPWHPGVLVHGRKGTSAAHGGIRDGTWHSSRSKRLDCSSSCSLPASDRRSRLSGCEGIARRRGGCRRPVLCSEVEASTERIWPPPLSSSLPSETAKETSSNNTRSTYNLESLVLIGY